MFCQKCGSEISEGNQFCTECGFSVEESKKYLISRNEKEPASENKDLKQNENSFPAEKNGETPSADIDTDKNKNADQNTSSDNNADEAVKPDLVDSKAGKAKKKLSPAPTAVLSVMFGLLCFIFLLLSQILITARHSLMNGSISAAVINASPTEIKVGSYVKSDSMKEILEKADIDPEKIDEDLTLGEFIPMLSDEDIDSDKIEEFFKDSEIMNIFSSLTGNYEEYLIKGETSEEISVDSIMESIKSHSDEIKEYFDIDINEYTDSIEEGLKNVNSEIQNLNPENAMGEAGKYIHIILSPYGIALAIALAVIFAALIFLITKRIKPALLTLGISSLAAGIIMLSVSLFNSLIVSSAMSLDKAVSKFLSSILNNAFFDFSLKLSLIFAGFGLLLIVARILIKVFDKSKNKEAENA